MTGSRSDQNRGRGANGAGETHERDSSRRSRTSRRSSYRALSPSVRGLTVGSPSRAANRMIGRQGSTCMAGPVPPATCDMAALTGALALDSARRLVCPGSARSFILPRTMASVPRGAVELDDCRRPVHTDVVVDRHGNHSRIGNVQGNQHQPSTGRASRGDHRYLQVSTKSARAALEPRISPGL
jgi:hypothetical protein